MFSQCMGFSALLLLQTHTHTKIIVAKTHFHSELIAASPVVIGQKPAKLFKLLYRTTQGSHCIVFIMNVRLQQMYITIYLHGMGAVNITFA